MELNAEPENTGKNKKESDSNETKQRRLKPKITKESERSNLIAKRLQNEAFYPIWQLYDAKENIEKISKEKLAAHFFYLGAKAAFEHKTKDYNVIIKNNENKKLKELQTQKKLKEIKRNTFKIKKNKGLDIKKTIKLLKSALEENIENETIKEELEKEIQFLIDYEKKKEQ